MTVSYYDDQHGQCNETEFVDSWRYRESDEETWGILFGRQLYNDFNWYNYTCTAGNEDPLTDTFSNDKYAVQV